MSESKKKTGKKAGRQSVNLKKDLVLAIDFGTQSTRALIFDKEGQIVAMEKIDYESYYSAQPGWAEQDPKIYWQNMCQAIGSIKKQDGGLIDRLRCVVVTALRDTVVCLDSDNEVVRPTIIWLDQRMASGSPDLNKAEEAMVNVIGMKRSMDILFRRAKSNWLRENEPDNWAKIDKYLQVSGYINYLLTGKFLDSNACQIGYIPFDYKNKTWCPPGDMKGKIMFVERHKLPVIVEPASLLGTVTESAATDTGLPEGLPVIAGGSDKGCETLGVGCVDETRASISLGTTATIQTTTTKYYEAIRFLPPYPAVVPGCYNPEIQIFRGYWLISWFKKEFSQKEVVDAKKMNIAPETLLNSRLEEVPPGCHGLLLQPMWSPGILNPTAKGSVIGFGDVHTRNHLYRAIVEGIGFSLYGGMKSIEKKSGKKVKELSVSGGGSQSDAICQITSDIFNLPVKRIHTHEASGLGAAIIGFVGTGVYSSFGEAIGNMVHYRDKFEPRPENVKIYHELYSRVFTRMYPRLKTLFDNIQEITGYPKL